jgi:hypothetical protein
VQSLHGSCLCGAVRFAIEGPFPQLYQCHCSLCRKQGGSVSNTGLIVRATRFRWLKGEGNIGKWQRSTGFRSHFCSRCGAPVPNPLRETGYVWVPSGLLDGDEPLAIGAQLYLGSKATWARVPDEGLHFDEAPPMAELVALLHAGPGANR